MRCVTATDSQYSSLASLQYCMRSRVNNSSPLCHHSRQCPAHNQAIVHTSKIVYHELIPSLPHLAILSATILPCSLSSGPLAWVAMMKLASGWPALRRLPPTLTEWPRHSTHVHPASPPTSHFCLDQAGVSLDQQLTAS